MTLKKYQHTVTDASCHFWWRTSCEKGRLSDQFPSKFNISTLNILPGGRLHHSLFALLRLITMEKPYRHSDLIKRTCSYYKSGTVIGNSCFQVRTKLGKWQWEEDMLSLPEWEQNSGKNSNDGEAAKGGNSRHFPSDKLHLGGILLWPFPICAEVSSFIWIKRTWMNKVEVHHRHMIVSIHLPAHICLFL